MSTLSVPDFKAPLQLAQPAPGLVLSAAELALSFRAFIKPARSIGGIVAQITISEHHRDTLELTDHPVERGSPITDHAFMRPAEVTIKCGWSNTPPAVGFITNPLTGITNNSPRSLTVQEVYEKLRDLMRRREPFDVLTGKRKYTNMLITGLEVDTDKESENALLVTVSCREVLIVGTEVITLGPATDSTSQSSPSITATPINAGTKSLQPAPLFNPQAGP